MEYWGIIILLVTCWVIQILFTIRQNNNYRSSLKEVKRHRRGHIGVGVAKAKFNLGRGVAIIIVADLDGSILEFREMKGITVFSKFKVNKKFTGQNVKTIAAMLTRKKESLAFEQAIGFINKERAKNKIAQLEI